MSTTLNGVSSQTSLRYSVSTTTSSKTTASSSDTGSADAHVSLGQSTTSTDTYADPRASLREARPDLASLLEKSEQDVARFMAQLGDLVEQQGLAWDKLVSGEQQLQASPEDIAAAQAAVAEDGEWGVRKTAERILDFALFAVGGDSSKLDTIRSAIDAGFASAREQLGGKLPQISEDTYAAVMGEFERWASEGLPEGKVSLAKPAEDSAG